MPSLGVLGLGTAGLEDSYTREGEYIIINRRPTLPTVSACRSLKEDIPRRRWRTISRPYWISTHPEQLSPRIMVYFILTIYKLHVVEYNVLSPKPNAFSRT